MKRMLAKLMMEDCTVYLCGNGGSAANANHIANDLLSVKVRTHSLCANVATLTAIANDFDYSEVFSRQLAVLGRERDILIAFSGSGTSRNIVKAILMARKLDMLAVLVTGAYQDVPPPILRQVQYEFQRGNNMQEAEEAQLELGHHWMQSIRRRK